MKKKTKKKEPPKKASVRKRAKTKTGTIKTTKVSFGHRINGLSCNHKGVTFDLWRADVKRRLDEKGIAPYSGQPISDLLHAMYFDGTYSRHAALVVERVSDDLEKAVVHQNVLNDLQDRDTKIVELQKMVHDKDREIDQRRNEISRRVADIQYLLSRIANFRETFKQTVNLLSPEHDVRPPVTLGDLMDQPVDDNDNPNKVR
jgi:hypothetical protein